jgi:hypothetical protein
MTVLLFVDWSQEVAGPESGRGRMIRSAAFSPIMMVVALMLTQPMVGITDASAIRRPSMP